MQNQQATFLSGVRNVEDERDNQKQLSKHEHEVKKKHITTAVYESDQTFIDARGTSLEEMRDPKNDVLTKTSEKQKKRTRHKVRKLVLQLNGHFIVSYNNYFE